MTSARSGIMVMGQHPKNRNIKRGLMRLGLKRTRIDDELRSKDVFRQKLGRFWRRSLGTMVSVPVSISRKRYRRFLLAEIASIRSGAVPSSPR